MDFLILILVVAALAIFVVPRFLPDANSGKKVKKLGVAGIVAVILILVLFQSFIKINPGEVGVQLLLGNVLPRTLENGPHFKLPIIKVVKYDVQLQEYTMSMASDEGERRGDDSIDVLTKEGLSIKLDLTCWYRMDPKKAQEVHEQIGRNYRSKVVRPLVREAIRTVSAQYSVNEFYSSTRFSIVSNLQDYISPVLQEKGFIFDRLLLRNVVLPDNVAQSIEQKLSEKQNAERAEFEAQKRLIEAQGILDYNRTIAKSLSANYIRWYRIEMLKELVKSPNNTIIVIPEDMDMPPLMMNNSSGN